MENSKIPWCDHSFSPWIGCAKCSPGCDNCYAELSHGQRYKMAEWGHGKERKRTSESNWKQPLAWNKKAKASSERKLVFTGSLCDIFDHEAPDEWRDDLFHLIGETPYLTWLILTKRPELLCLYRRKHYYTKWQKNIWYGVTACSQKEANRKIPYLLAIKKGTEAAKYPTPVCFVSIEPILEAIDLHRFEYHRCNECLTIQPSHCFNFANADAGDCSIYCPECGADEEGVGDMEIPGLDWVIAGAETGPNARPANLDWFRSLRDQCRDADVPFFLKQVSANKNNHTLDGVEHREFPR